MKTFHLSIISAVFVIILVTMPHVFAQVSCQGRAGVVNPQLVVSGAHQYMAWSYFSGCWNSEVFFKSSNDNGTHFGNQIEIGNDTIKADEEPVIAASGNNVYIAWQHLGQNPVLFFRKSTDYGATFENPVIVGEGDRGVPQKKIILRGNQIEIVWSGQLRNLNRGAYLSTSTDGGASFENTIPLSNEDEDSATIDIKQSGNTTYVSFNIFKKCAYNKDFQCIYQEVATFDINDPLHTHKLSMANSVVPEFGSPAEMIIIISLVGVILISNKFRLHISQNNSSE